MSIFEVILSGALGLSVYRHWIHWRRPIYCNHCRNDATGAFTINGVRSNYCEDHKELYIQGSKKRLR